MNKTKIEWCDSTWNPVTGCLHGCEYCYARTMVNRFGAKIDPDFSENIVVLDNPVFKEKKSDALPKINPKREPYPYGFIPTLHKYRLYDCEYKHQKGRNIFVCSMADLFGEWVPDEWINEVMKACADAPKHNYLFLTKNPKRYRKIYNEKFPGNIWLGATVTNNFEMDKVGYQLYDSTTSIGSKFIDVAKRFLSIEPLHGKIEKQLLENVKYFNWIIIGAESGNRKEKIVPEKEWINSITEQCNKFSIPVFMKDSLVPIVGEESMRREFPKELKK
ncbi:DUF5131 family protein [Acetobacterium wieringae]|uniref:DUF5131 family protein n=1 Tax=Acetobacterium wieringae TaxID=52694 RepID=UPI002B203699|nr:DUF5131 family protein [Acetobacterium wieringae]MEA4805117.1 DUF5131 family protein [Acetobacterium wieringae]